VLGVGVDVNVVGIEASLLLVDGEVVVVVPVEKDAGIVDEDTEGGGGEG
jgi:hypothetical protein